MVKALGSYAKDIVVLDSLDACFDAAVAKAHGRKTAIVFSPAAKSFEKFKNEYDRGERFNQLVARWRDRRKRQ